MNANFDKIIEKINSGKLTRKELENLRKNAIAKGGANVVVSACESMLAILPRPRSGGSKPSSEVAEKRSGYNIMSSALDSSGNLIKPELIEVAEELATYNLVTDISVLKTQIKLYYKGRHFTAGCKPNKSVFWISCLDETKISDQSIECWKKLGNIVGGTYFATRYVTIEVNELHKLHTAFECVAFT
ncbi:hypothetical protein [Aeromonas sp. L_1B5_3]|uniref:hypothetical protein n=1 Tax=Aeromonas sp. L_1B5_3 TaxID=1588629 RepID=UPI000A603BD0|nr:hypothetical protein [Aeromonas sp. L_1B5_3]